MIEQHTHRPMGSSLAGPLYLQVYELMKRRVKEKEWQLGQSLPNEGELARNFGVSVGTMRKAMEALEGAGWVVRYQGRGTFVANIEANQISRFGRLYSGAENLSASPFMFDNQDVGEATKDEAKKLKIAPGSTVVRLSALRRIRGKATIADLIVVPSDVFPGLRDRSLSSISGHPFAVYFQDFGVTVASCKERVVAAPADETAVDLLGVESGTAILVSEEVAYDERKKPVHWCKRYAHLIAAEYVVEVA